MYGAIVMFEIQMADSLDPGSPDSRIGHSRQPPNALNFEAHRMYRRAVGNFSICQLNESP
jgi:hypothetical protein